MLHTTQGIVLRVIKYRETSVIAKIFTRDLGRQTYVVPSVRTKRPKYNMALFQPLTRLEIIAYHKEQRSIQRLSEAQCHTPNDTILDDVRRGAIAIFLTELLTKVIQEEEKNEKLFDFLWQAIGQLNEQTIIYDFFLLTFMLQLSHYLGFGIHVPQDLHTSTRHGGQNRLRNEEVDAGLRILLLGKEATYQKVDLITKQHITNALLVFYQSHVGSLKTLHSLELLRIVDM